MKDFPFMAAMIGIAVYASTANSRTAGAISSTVNAGNAAGGTVSYCPSSGASTAYEYIQLIDFGGIDYVSGNNNGYGDFTSVIGNIIAGQMYSIQGKTGYTGAVRNEVWTVYIDYNADGDFTDPGEKVGSTATSTPFLVTKTFKIPQTAKNGLTRMRIQMHYNTRITDPCAKFKYGEVEDYTINISGGSNTADDVLAGNSISDISVAPNPVTSSSIRVDYTLEKEGYMVFDLIAANGLTRRTYKAGIQTKGENSYQLNNLSSLHSGNYYISFKQDGIVIGRTSVLIAH